MQRTANVGALDSYFRSAPYRRWFDQGFERVLNGLSATYYAGFPNAALHTDLLSPLATDPTWGGLAREPDPPSRIDPTRRITKADDLPPMKQPKIRKG
jgi:hypothetical protein